MTNSMIEVLKLVRFTLYKNHFARAPWTVWGTGMIAGGSTFRPHPGRVIKDLFCLLDAVYGIVRKH